jgi:hypothetical protein
MRYSEEAVWAAPLQQASIPSVLGAVGRAKTSSSQLKPYVSSPSTRRRVPSPAANREKDADHVRGRDDEVEDDHCQEHGEDLLYVGCKRNEFD